MARQIPKDRAIGPCAFPCSQVYPKWQIRGIHVFTGGKPGVGWSPFLFAMILKVGVLVQSLYKWTLNVGMASFAGSVASWSTENGIIGWIHSLVDGKTCMRWRPYFCLWCWMLCIWTNSSLSYILCLSPYASGSARQCHCRGTDFLRHYLTPSLFFPNLTH